VRHRLRLLWTGGLQSILRPLCFLDLHNNGGTLMIAIAMEFRYKRAAVSTSDRYSETRLCFEINRSTPFNQRDQGELHRMPFIAFLLC
jgi:hypothetical protein